VYISIGALYINVNILSFNYKKSTWKSACGYVDYERIYSKVIEKSKNPAQHFCLRWAGFPPLCSLIKGAYLPPKPLRAGTLLVVGFTRTAQSILFSEPVLLDVFVKQLKTT